MLHIQSWSLNSAVVSSAGSCSSVVKISWHDFGTSIVRLRDHKDPEQCGPHTRLSRTHRERRPHLKHSAAVQQYGTVVTRHH